MCLPTGHVSSDRLCDVDRQVEPHMTGRASLDRSSKHHTALRDHARARRAREPVTTNGTATKDSGLRAVPGDPPEAAHQDREHFCPPTLHPLQAKHPDPGTAALQR